MIRLRMHRAWSPSAIRQVSAIKVVSVPSNALTVIVQMEKNQYRKVSRKSVLIYLENSKPFFPLRLILVGRPRPKFVVNLHKVNRWAMPRN